MEKKRINIRDIRWITLSIKILCDLKNDFYLLNKQCNNQILNDRYKFISKTLKKTYKMLQNLTSIHKSLIQQIQ
jgi:hypothetical protein